MRKRRFWQIASLFTLLISFQEAQAQEPEIADSFQYPLDNYIPGSYGGRVFGCCSRRHLGEDAKADPLTPVKAIANGMIITGVVSKAHSCYGMVVVIEYTLLDGSKITSIYGHMSNRKGYKPKLSGIVKRGEIIGYVGHSGGRPPYSGSPRKCGNYLDDENGDGDPHLHLGLRLAPAPKNKYGRYIWKYFGYQGYGEDVDYDSRGKAHGGKFTAAKKFMDAYNEKYHDRDEDGYTVSQGDCNDDDPAINPGSPDLCDGWDNNCDGEIDENYQPTAERVGLGDACSEGYSDCRQWGARVCSADGRATVCDARPKEPEPELCDGLDNDCDGQVDEAWKTGSSVDLGKTCAIGAGPCQTGGKWICAPDGRGAVCDAPVITPTEEFCDDLDNDCDGEIDEDFPSKGQPCTLGLGECQVTGIGVCSETDPYTVYCSVAPGQPQPELCDDLDNDCDGEVDEDFPQKGQLCTVGIGACADSGIVVCSADGTATLCSVAPKQPDCTGKQCGDDGCGGSCGSCVADEICNNGVCQCVPDCAGKQCGDDPICGFSCGSCVADEICSNGICQCAPDCAGKQCGDDGCGGSCGSCAGGRTCLSGQCQNIGPSWVKLYPSNKPSPRDNHAMAYDSARSRVVLFGGYSNVTGNCDGSGFVWCDGTYEWSGINWIQFSPSNKPSMRANHAMAYDSARSRVVLFGGWDSANWFGDTWEWAGVNWIKLFSVNSPPPQMYHAMAYDSARSRVVLFGGNETWEWNGISWTQLFPVNRPSSQGTHAMAYDAALGKVILFGGYDNSGNCSGGSNICNDTWEWDGTNWTQLFPINKPSPRQGHAMAYDAALGKVILFGGYDNSGNCSGGSNICNDTWEWDGTNWTQLFPINKPSPRRGHAIAYDAAHTQIVLFGGYSFSGCNGSGSNFCDDTWVYGP